MWLSLLELVVYICQSTLVANVFIKQNTIAQMHNSLLISL